MKKMVTKSLTDTGGLTIPIDIRFRTGIRENRLVDIIDQGDGKLGMPPKPYGDSDASEIS